MGADKRQRADNRQTTPLLKMSHLLLQLVHYYIVHVDECME